MLANDVNKQERTKFGNKTERLSAMAKKKTIFAIFATSLTQKKFPLKSHFHRVFVPKPGNIEIEPYAGSKSNCLQPWI